MQKSKLKLKMFDNYTVLFITMIFFAAGCETSNRSVRKFFGTKKRPEFTIRIASRVHESNYTDYTLRLRKKKKIEGTDMTLEIVRYIPDFSYSNSRREVVSLSAKPLNPALEIMLYQTVETKNKRTNLKPIKKFWVFYKYPKFSVKTLLPIIFYFTDYKNVYQPGEIKR